MTTVTNSNSWAGCKVNYNSDRCRSQLQQVKELFSGIFHRQKVFRLISSQEYFQNEWTFPGLK